jgi:hypothetical protein
MQCFQKDPNLRVSARKLLKHAWIVGCRRSDAQVSKAPPNYDQAVADVMQWNKALKSSESAPRISTGSEPSAPPPAAAAQTQAAPRHVTADSRGATPANFKGALALGKSRPTAEAFRSPELAGRSLSRAAMPLGKS